MNSYINYTRSYSYAAVKCLTDPLGPMNEGALRPITVTAPEGSFLNPRPPAGGGPRAIICYRMFEAVIGALAPALPERVAAAASHFANPTFGGWDRARAAPLRRVRAGAVRHRRARHAGRLRGHGVGLQRVEHPGGGAGGQPADRGGALRADPRLRRAPGTFRGGCGVRRDHAIPRRRGQAHESLRAPAVPALRASSAGEPGALARTVINPGPGEEIVHGKASREFAYGDVISFQQSGAGRLRRPARARSPRACSRTCWTTTSRVEAARARYGVVIVERSGRSSPSTTRPPRALRRSGGRAMIRFTPEQEEFRPAVARFVDAEVVPAGRGHRRARRVSRGALPASSASSATSRSGIPRRTAARTPTW